MNRLEIKPSSLDKQVPEGIQVVYRVTERASGRRGPPRTIADFNSVEAAQQFSDKLTAKGHPHSFLTWWRFNNRHVHKWATIMHGKRRHFKVTVPYVPGLSDPMVKTYILDALLSVDDKPPEYTRHSPRIGIDPDENRLESDFRVVQLRLNEACAAKLRDMPPEVAAQLVERAILG